MKAALVLAALGLACADASSADEPADPRTVVVGLGEEIFPTESLADWVSYAVQVSELTVVSEAEIPPPAAVLERREGYIGRTIAVRVERTFWTSTGARTPGASADPASIVVAGWILKGTRRIPFALERSPRVEVGGRYIMALTTLLRPDVSQPAPPRTTRADGSAPEPTVVAWGPMSTGAVLAAFADPVASADVAARGQGDVARSLSPLSPEQLVQTLAETAPHPHALAHWHLPPLERFHATQRR